MKNKITASILIFSILVHSFFAPIIVLAQEATPEPSATPEVIVIETPSPSPEASLSPTPTPIPTPTMSPDEYDVYKEQKNIADVAQESRDAEWDANENNPEWVTAHGGDQANYISGAWTPTPSPTPSPSLDPFVTPDPLAIPDPLATPDPFACPSPSPSTADITNNNCAVIDNTSETSGVSGENTVTGNDGTVDVATGNSSADGNLQNNANTNVSSADNPSVVNNNAAVVDNEMSVEGTSGNNTLTENDGEVTLTTGDVELIANMLNILNLNVTGDDFLHLIVNIFGQLNGNLDLDDIAHALGYADDDALKVIAQTEDSTADAEMSVDNTNDAVVNNELDVTGTTGGNNVSGNDGGANVVTGRIEIMANLLNFINANFSGDKWKFIMVNIFGSLNGNIVVPATDNFTENSTTSIDQTSVNNTNSVNLTNNVNAQGVSGNNQQNGNDDEGHTVSTGQTNVETNILNFLNMNITGNNWVFLIVNVFGRWMGQIVGFGDSPAIDAPENGTFAALSTGGASNGEEQINQTTAVNNTNSATVNNNVNVSGVSGQNQVNGNDGTTNIETGWVEINANLLNIINTNITGRNWMVVFLNVFGDFMGNLFFGHEMTASQQSMPIAEETEEDIVEIGGIDTASAQSNNQNTNTPNNSPAPLTSAAPKPKKPVVLALNIEDDFSEESYQAVYEEEEPLSDNHEYEKLGFLALVLQFVNNIITKIQPVFAHVINLLPLS